MFPLLSLATLALASGSDREESSEEAWAERFLRCDALRTRFGIPPLTPGDRMKVLLGQGGINPEYRLNVRRNTSLPPSGYFVILEKNKDFPATCWCPLQRVSPLYSTDREANAEGYRLSREMWIVVSQWITE